MEALVGAAAAPAAVGARPRRRSLRGYPFALGLGLALAALTAVPYFYAGATQPHGRVFMGFFFLADDANTYLAKMREGWEGTWLWTNRYSTEGSPGAYFFTFWLFLGRVAGLFHLSLPAMYQAARMAGSVALLGSAWAFIRHFVPGVTARRFALWFCAVGLGCGYVIQALHHPVVFGSQTDTLDWRMPELSAFYSVLALPHFVWAAAFEAVAAVLTLAAIRRGSLKLAGLAGLAWTAEASIHAQMLLLLGPAIVAATVLAPPRRRGFAALALAFLIPLPYVAYSYLAYLGNPEVARWSSQWRNNLPPDGLSLVLALAPQLVLAALAVPGAIRRRTREDLFLLAWLVFLIAILWLPNPAGNLRRRFFDGVYLPLVVLAARGMYEVLVPRLRSLRAQRLVPFSAVAAASIGSFFLLLAPMAFASQPIYSVSAGEYAALQWLSAQPRGTVLSTSRMGLYVPAYSSDTVYVGQYSETYNFREKGLRAYRLLTGAEEILPFAAGNGIRYVLWSDELPGDPPTALGEPAYSAGGARVYRLPAPGQGAGRE